MSAAFFTLLLPVPTTAPRNPTIRRHQQRFGWFNVDHRGTASVLYGCLSTIVACTYTGLHLNVPSPQDGLWTRVLRKAKGMVFTIMFPEFAFAKVVCELQMATEDLCELRAASAAGSFNWNFSHGSTTNAINRAF